MGESKALAVMDERTDRPGSGIDLLDSGKWVGHDETGLRICYI